MLKTSQLPAIVLGINDSLIELTGALVGLSFALNRNRLVALAGLITGVAASLSMAASAFMHARQEKDSAAAEVGIYTGVSYLIVVILLVSPYFLFDRLTLSLLVMMAIALAIIVLMSWYSAVHNRKSFWSEFGIMLVFSLGVAIISFLISKLLQRLIGINL